MPAQNNNKEHSLTSPRLTLRAIGALTLTIMTDTLLLKVNMGAGHGGASGRYAATTERAFITAWMLSEWGITQ